MNPIAEVVRTVRRLVLRAVAREIAERWVAEARCDAAKHNSGVMVSGAYNAACAVKKQCALDLMGPDWIPPNATAHGGDGRSLP